MDTYSPEEKFILHKLEGELPDNLTYHGFHHTIYVLDAAMKIASTENISSEEKKLLRIAVLYHDAGFLTTYKNHEERGCEMAKNDLPAFDYSNDEIDIICGIIMATKIPQSPKTLLEKIICDADLDYLGGEDFHKTSNLLFREVKNYMNVEDEKEWNIIQKNFLEHHQYFTEYAKKNLEPQKQKRLQEIIQIL